MTREFLFKRSQTYSSREARNTLEDKFGQLFKSHFRFSSRETCQPLGGMPGHRLWGVGAPIMGCRSRRVAPRIGHSTTCGKNGPVLPFVRRHAVPLLRLGRVQHRRKREHADCGRTQLCPKRPAHAAQPDEGAHRGNQLKHRQADPHRPVKKRLHDFKPIHRRSPLARSAPAPREREKYITSLLHGASGIFRILPTLVRTTFMEPHRLPVAIAETPR